MRFLESAPTSPAARSDRRAGVWVTPQVRLGDRVPAADLETFARLAPPRRFLRGERLYRHGDPAEGFFLLLRGTVRVQAPDGAGGSRTVAVLGPNDLFGTSCCTADPVHRSEASVLGEEAYAVSLACPQLEEVARHTPRIALLLWEAMAARVQDLEEQVEQAHLPVQARLARTLIGLAERFGTEVAPGEVELRLELRHYELAALSGTTRVSATQALGAWRELGVLSGTRGVYRLKPTQLAALTNLLEDELW